MAVSLTVVVAIIATGAFAGVNLLVQSGERTAKQARAESLILQEPAEVGGIQFLVHTYLRAVQVGSQPAPEGMQYLLVDVSVRNTGEREALGPGALAVTALLDGKRIDSLDPDRLPGGSGSANETWYGPRSGVLQISPGDHREGRLVYLLPFGFDAAETRVMVAFPSGEMRGWRLLSPSELKPK